MVEASPRAVDQEGRADLQDDAAELTEPGLTDATLLPAPPLPRFVGSGGIDDAQERLQHIIDALAGHRRQHVGGLLRGALETGQLLLQGFGIERIGLRQGDDLRLLVQAVTIGLQFLADDLIGLAGMLARPLDEVQENAAALDMAEEAVPEPGALGRALDQARYVGQHEFASDHPDHAEAGVERRERVIRDLGLGGGHGGQERGLARIGQAHQAGIGDELQAKDDPALLAVLAGIGAARRPIGRGGEIGVAEPSVAAFGKQHPLAHMGHVGDDRLAVHVEDFGAGRDLEDHVRGFRSGAVLAHAVAPRLGLEMHLVAVIDQGVQALDALGPHVAAAAAVAAIGPAELDEFLSPERHGARAAVAGPNIDLRLIEELHSRLSYGTPGAGETQGDTAPYGTSSAGATRSASNRSRAAWVSNPGIRNW